MQITRNQIKPLEAAGSLNLSNIPKKTNLYKIKNADKLAVHKEALILFPYLTKSFDLFNSIDIHNKGSVLNLAVNSDVIEQRKIS